MRFLCIIFSFLILGLVGANAQPDELFGTWYLVYVEPDTGDPPATYVDFIEPAINPYITINEDLSFTGESACNTFSGQFESIFDDTALGIIEFSRTTNTCEFESHIMFDNSYWIYWEAWIPYDYFLAGSGDASTLTLIKQFGFEQFFQRLPLTVDENEVAKTKLYPNPANDSFQISGIVSDTARLTITGSSGLQLEMSYKNGESVDVSTLASGIYLVTLTDHLRQQHFKLVKL